MWWEFGFGFHSGFVLLSVLLVVVVAVVVVVVVCPGFLDRLAQVKKTTATKAAAAKASNLFPFYWYKPSHSIITHS